MKTRPLERVLYVEDDPDIQLVIRLALETVGRLAVRACASGAEALASAPAFSPDLVLLDVMMPGMDGPATLAALRSRPELAETPVVFMTAKVQAHEVESYKRLGVAEVITKPFDPMTLAASLREVWARLGSGA